MPELNAKMRKRIELIICPVIIFTSLFLSVNLYAEKNFDDFQDDFGIILYEDEI